MRRTAFRESRIGFSLIELVIVLAILAAITAIAIPRLSRAAENADVKALQADLETLRKAIEFYWLDHDRYPTLPNFIDQLTRQTNKAGFPGTDFGPYLVNIPPLKVGNKKGNTGIAGPGTVPPVVEVNAPGTGWLYHATSGRIWANAHGHFDK